MLNRCAPADPVFELVARYQTIEADYDSCPLTDEKRLDELRDKHTAVLLEVDGTEASATSLDGALAAIRQALREETRWTTDLSLAASFLRMGLAFFDARDQSPSAVAGLIAAYEAAGDAWEATSEDGNLSAEGPEYEAFYATERAFVAHQCTSFAEAEEKIAYLTKSRDFMDALFSGGWGDEPYLETFMKSLMVGRPVDIGGK